MNRFLKTALLAAMAASMLPFSGCGAEEKSEGEEQPARTVYVSLTGSDEADGSAEAPFASISKAKEYVRTLRKSGGDIVVEIADGFYALDETLIFDENDSAQRTAGSSGEPQRALTPLSAEERYSTANGRPPRRSTGCRRGLPPIKPTLKGTQSFGRYM